MSRLIKIDTHNHIMPDHIPRWADKYGYSGFIHLEHHKKGAAKMMIDDKFFREVQANCWDPQARFDDCTEFGVDIQVLSTIPVLFHYWAKPAHALETSQFFNDHIASIVSAHPHRFIGLATLPMQNPSMAIQEMERCMNDLGMAGIQIGSHINDWNLNDPALHEFYSAAESLGAAILVHPWDMMGKNKMEKYWLPWLVGMPAETSLAICSMIFGGIFEKFPKLRVAFAHGGGSFPATIGRIEHGYKVRPDLCAIDNDHNPKEYLGKFYLDSIVHDPFMLEYIVNLVGEDKVILGSDYPFPLGELEPGRLIESSNLSIGVKKKLLSSNALEWLNIPASSFPQFENN